MRANLLRKTILALTGLLILLACPAGTSSQQEAQNETFHFVPWALWIDSGQSCLAAYQVEVSYDPTRVFIVGIEAGPKEAFSEAPYYDPRGLTAGRIIIAAFSKKDNLAPPGRTKVCRLHLMVKGEAGVELVVRVMVAAAPGGEKLSVKAEVEPE